MLEGLGYWLRLHVTGKIRLRPFPPRPEDVRPPQNPSPFYTQVLATLPAPERLKIQTVWDVGCGGWTYLPALAAAFPKAVLFTGVEVDPGRRLRNLYTRGDVATAFALESSRLGHPTRLLFQDFLDIPMVPQFHAAFCFFFPFVSERPARRWGLPSRFVNFDKLLSQALIGRGRSGVIVSCHQGEWERDLALEAYKRCGLSPQMAVIPSAQTRAHWPSEYDTHVLMLREQTGP